MSGVQLGAFSVVDLMNFLCGEQKVFLKWYSGPLLLIPGYLAKGSLSGAEDTMLLRSGSYPSRRRCKLLRPSRSHAMMLERQCGTKDHKPRLTTCMCPFSPAYMFKHDILDLPSPLVS